MNNDTDTKILSHPETVWRETDEMLKACRDRVKRLRLRAVHNLAGHPHEVIAKTLGIDRYSVASLMTQANKLFGKAVNTRPMSPTTEKRVAFLRANAALGPTECARRLGISQPSVNNLFKRYLPDIRFVRGRRGGLSA